MGRETSVLNWYTLEAYRLRRKLDNLAHIGAIERQHAFRLMILLQQPTKPAINEVKAEIARALE